MAHDSALLRQVDKLQSIGGGVHAGDPVGKVLQTMNTKMS